MVLFNNAVVLSVKKTSGVFGGVTTGPIHLVHVRCTGEELQLINCNFSIIHTCTHTQDVGVVCPGKSSPVYLLFPVSALYNPLKFRLKPELL